MKRFLAFAVATLMFAVASSTQAVEVKLHTFSRAADRISESANDIGVRVLDQDQNVVAESVGGDDEVNFNIRPGDYTIVAEQESTGYNGQQLLPVPEDGFSGSLTLSSFGLLITDYSHEALKKEQERVADMTIEPVRPVTTVPQLPQLPGSVPAATGYTGGMGGWAMLGAVGAMIATTIAVTADDDETGVTPVYRYR